MLKHWLSPADLVEEFFDQTPLNKYRSSWPPEEVRQLEDRAILNYALAGWKREDISITFQGNVLTISGNKIKNEEEKNSIVYSGFCNKNFNLQRQILKEVDTINAKMEDGVLSVEVIFKAPQQVQIAIG